MPDQIAEIPVALIDASPYQPRRRFEEERLEELAASIRQHGFIQPIVLRPSGSRYQVIAGERRLRAARRLALEMIPALIRPLTDEQALEAALVENLQREEISVVEAALAYQRLADEFGYTQGRIAQQTGKSRAVIANTVRLLHLPESVLDLLDAGDLTEGHARALLALPYPSLQAELSEWIVRNAVTVRETEQKARELLAGPGGSDGTRKPAARDVHVEALEERLRRQFGTKVTLTYRNGRGTLTLEFYTDDDLHRLLEQLGTEE